MISFSNEISNFPILFSGLGSFYTELMRGLGASSRLWHLVDKKPTIPLSGLLDKTVLYKAHSYVILLSFV